MKNCIRQRNIVIHKQLKEKEVASNFANSTYLCDSVGEEFNAFIAVYVLLTVCDKVTISRV